jgi:hypothetical protein
MFYFLRLLCFDFLHFSYEKPCSKERFFTVHNIILYHQLKMTCDLRPTIEKL